MAANFLGLVSAWFPRLFQKRAAGFRVLSDYHAFERSFDTVKTEDYLGIPAVWAAVRLISETAASLPLPLYRREEETSGRIRVRNHPAAELFRRPNQDQTEIEFRETLFSSAIIYGFGYAQIIRDDRGRAVQLQPIPARSVTAEPSSFVSGQTIYTVTHEDQSVEYIPAENMFVLSNFLGRGLVEVCSRSLELTRAAEEYANAVFTHGARPGGVLTHPSKLSPDAADRLRREWEAKHSGVDNSFRTAILQEGMTYTAISGTSEDAQAVEMRNFQIRETCRIFGIPPSKLRVDGASYGSLEQENLSFLQDCLRPWLVRFEQAAREKLLLSSERDGMYWEHSIDGILRADIVSRYKSYSIAKNWGILNSDEIRALENYPSIPGGDVFMAPANMSPLVPDLGAPGARAPGSDSPTVALDDTGDDPTPVDPFDLAATVGAPTNTPTPPAKQQGGADVASTALNGAQISSLVELVNQVGQGLVPAESAKAIAQASFPFIDQSVIAGIFDPVVVRPAPAPEPQPTGRARRGKRR